MLYRLLISLLLTSYSVLAADAGKKESVDDVTASLASLSLHPPLSPAAAEGVEDKTLIKEKTANLTFSSLTPATADVVEALIVESNTHPLNPQIGNSKGMVDNHLKRIEAGNYYHLVTFFKGDVLQAAMIQGQMPKTGYKTDEHARVIAKFAELLPKGEAAKPYGFSTMVPVFGKAVDENGRAEVYTAMMGLNKNLAQQRRTLPQVSKDLIPCQLLILLDPGHPDVELLVKLGFTNQGNYPEFYPPAIRTLLSYPLV